MKRNKILSSNRAITLVALIITIIVMLILVAVTVTILVDSDIIGQSEKAGALYKNAYEEENVGNVIIDGIEYNSFTEYLQSKCEHEFGEDGVCIKCKMGCIHSFDSRGICTECGMRCIHSFDSKGICTECGMGCTHSFDSKGICTECGFKRITLGSLYSDSKIGQKITYSANGQNDWIVLGRDNQGNILITTEEPVEDGFNLGGGALAWLTYEEDLQEACKVYGVTVQGKKLSARSMNLNDIEKLIGVEMDTGTEFTFGTENDGGRKTNYMYPSLNAASNGYWKKPVVENELVMKEGFTSGYTCIVGQGMCEFYANNEWHIDLDVSDRAALVWGDYSKDNLFNEYLLGDKGFNPDSDNNQFCVGSVKSDLGKTFLSGFAKSIGIELGRAGEDSYTNNAAIGLCDIRPIVELPPSLEAELNNGVLVIAE